MDEKAFWKDRAFVKIQIISKIRLNIFHLFHAISHYSEAKRIKIKVEIDP